MAPPFLIGPIAIALVQCQVFVLYPDGQEDPATHLSIRPTPTAFLKGGPTPQPIVSSFSLNPQLRGLHQGSLRQGRQVGSLAMPCALVQPC